MSDTLLSQIRNRVTVDIDSMDPEVAARHTKDIKFCDMTSNQAIVYGEALRPERADLLKSAVEAIKKRGGNPNEEAFLQDVVDLFTVLLGKKVYPHLTGNVHAQTSPSTAYDTEKTVEHARKLVSIFEANKIPKERVCIKIPATAESMVACKVLAEMGIKTLATCLFSVPQAVAASQANCVYVAPYFNELRVHFEPSLWREYTHPAEDHPMSQTIVSIRQALRSISSKTQVMPASIVTVKEASQVVSLVSLKPDHITISGGLLDRLSQEQPMPAESFTTSLQPKLDEAQLSKDYLVQSGEALREAIQDDEEVTRKLADALSLFDDFEKKTRELVKTLL
uniref:Transaldolase n=1 Tax=Moniliophthora roreri TaxID=221103 RepID=A0A0W0FUW9_MONRR